jgi:hypothetical protein
LKTAGIPAPHVLPATAVAMLAPTQPPVTMEDPAAARPAVTIGAPVSKAAAAAAALAPRKRVRPEAARLTESAISLGQTWAEERRAELQREGRPAAGGWPGTLREARLRVERLLLGKLSPRSLAAVTGDEREEAARAAYASARVEWCRRAEPEAP